MTSCTRHFLLLAVSNGTTLIPNFVNISQYVLKFNKRHMRARAQHDSLTNLLYFLERNVGYNNQNSQP